MFCAFLTLLILVGGAGVLVWVGWRRVSGHLKNNPVAARLVAEHIVTPLLVGDMEQQPDRHVQEES